MSEASELERLRAQNHQLLAALDEAETRNQLVLEATNDGVWDWDLTTQEVFFSQRWKSILGYNPDDIPPTPSAFFDLIHEQDKARVDAAVQDHLQRRVPYVIDFRMRAKDGSYRTIQARGQCVWDTDGQPLRIAGIHTDVTERRQQERERLRNEELIAIQSETIHALGVPILQVWRGISCLPIIGAVDDERASEMTSVLLEHVSQTATRFAILDLTGAQFHPETVQHLGRITRSLQLIGAQGVLCGISPRMAGTLVDMDLDLEDVPTYRDLGDALRASLLRLRASATPAAR